MDPGEECYIDGVGDEILMMVLSKLSPYELCETVPYVCKRWRNLMNEQIVWKNAELIFDREGWRGVSKEYLERFVKTLNHAPRLSRLDISRTPYRLDMDTSPLPVASVIRAGSNLQRN